MMDFLGFVVDLIKSDAMRGALLLIGAIIAVFSIKTARQVARRKQAADMIFASRNDERLRAGLDCVQRLHNATDQNMRALVADDKVNSDDTKSFRYVLNHYEYVAVCVQNLIIDENLLKACSYSTIVSLFDQAEPFIKEVRQKKSRPTAFQELEWLVVRWKAKPLKTMKPTQRRIRWW